jgi:hypothetical protein
VIRIQVPSTKGKNSKLRPKKYLTVCGNVFAKYLNKLTVRIRLRCWFGSGSVLPFMMQLKQISDKNIYHAPKPTFYPIYIQSLKDGMKGFSFCHNLWSKASTLEDGEFVISSVADP